MIKPWYYSVTGSAIKPWYYSVTGNVITAWYYSVTGNVITAWYYSVTGNVIKVLCSSEPTVVGSAKCDTCLFIFISPCFLSCAPKDLRITSRHLFIHPACYSFGRQKSPLKLLHVQSACFCATSSWKEIYKVNEQ
jgi:hypothetical protein